MLDGPISGIKAKALPADAASTGTGTGTDTRTGAKHSAKPPVLIILHQEQSTPGQIGQWLRSAGFPLDIRRPVLGDALPESLRSHAGVIIFGGPMSAYDNHPYLAQERQLIELSLRENSPCLGVCLGGQLMAQVLGVDVRSDPLERAEIGYYHVEPTREGRAFCASWPQRFYQWHRDGFDLPDGAQLLASADGPFPNQAFCYNKTAIAIQFHPEITLAMIHRWTTLAAHRLSMSGTRPREQHFTDHLRFSKQVASWRACFLDNWLRLGTAQTPTEK